MSYETVCLLSEIYLSEFDAYVFFSVYLCFSCTPMLICHVA